MEHRAGFVNLLGRPNAGKSTLLNALVGEKLAIISPKVQTTRNRILGLLTTPGYQIVFSDTPGILDPHYKLHEKMRAAVQLAVEDADVALLVVDAAADPAQSREAFANIRLRGEAILVVNKADLVDEETINRFREAFQGYALRETIPVSALKRTNLEALLEAIRGLLPVAPAYYPEDAITDRPVRFFVSEMIREQVYALYHEEIPYHTAVLVRQFEEKEQVTVIAADIIVQRDTQKGIILGEKGKAIKQLGIRARKEIEAFLEKKVFLELHVKVRNKWRDNENFLREYGYS